MELRHLRYFLAVAEERNFRRAAERVGIAQPPLSSQIRDLETELGVLLFRRMPRGAELTDAGKAFLAAVPAVFERLEQAVRSARRAASGEVGELRVGYTGSTLFTDAVAGALRTLRRAFPDVDLSLKESNTDLLMADLLEGRLDAAFVRPGRQPPASLAITPLPPEDMVVVVPADHPLAERPALSLRELAGETLVMFSRELGAALHDEVVDACRAAGVEPWIGQIAPQITSVANLVAAGLGVSVLPAGAARAAPAVRCLRIDGPAPVARLALATRRGDRGALTVSLTRIARRWPDFHVEDGVPA